MGSGAFSSIRKGVNIRYGKLLQKRQHVLYPYLYKYSITFSKKLLPDRRQLFFPFVGILIVADHSPFKSISSASSDESELQFFMILSCE